MSISFERINDEFVMCYAPVMGIEEISKRDYENGLKEEYLQKVYRQYDLVEITELREVCGNIEKLGIEELENLDELIKERKYQEKFANSYQEMIHERIEFLHKKNSQIALKH